MIGEKSAGLDRRNFLRIAGSALVAGCAPAVRTSGRSVFNVVIRGGTVFDGSGNPGVENDIGIIGDKVAGVARALIGRGADEIDARGLAVAPGFIDIYSFADRTLFDDPRAESLIRQGITTVVVGQNGLSPAPASPDEVRRALTRAAGEPIAFDTFEEFFRTVESAQLSVNVAAMVGLDTVRRQILSDASRTPTALEMRRMTALVEEALRDGVCGASSEARHQSDGGARSDELSELCATVGAKSLPYAPQLRNMEDRIVESIDEAMSVARRARSPLQIAQLRTVGPNNWPKLGDVLSRIEEAGAKKLDVTFGMIPYLAYETELTSLFPEWSVDGGTGALMTRLDDPPTANRIRDEARRRVAELGGWDALLITSVGASADQTLLGQRLGTSVTDPYDVVLSLVRASPGGARIAVFAMSERNVERFLSHPRSIVVSGGTALATSSPGRIGDPHPASFGAFPRVMARYVRERHDLSLAAAVNKMTGFPAARLRFANRGRIALGAPADIVVFDPATIRDRSTFTDQFQYPDGIVAVLVNGVFALRDRSRTTLRSGVSVRPST